MGTEEKISQNIYALNEMINIVSIDLASSDKNINVPSNLIRH